MYPTDHVFIFFRIFIFYIFTNIFNNISMKPEVTQTNYLYIWRTIECFHSIGPHADGIFLTLNLTLSYVTSMVMDRLVMDISYE